MPPCWYFAWHTVSYSQPHHLVPSAALTFANSRNEAYAVLNHRLCGIRSCIAGASGGARLSAARCHVRGDALAARARFPKSCAQKKWVHNTQSSTPEKNLPGTYPPRTPPQQQTPSTTTVNAPTPEAGIRKSEHRPANPAHHLYAPLAAFG